jgi:uncharacterized protein (UPF0333 family)
MLFLKAILMPKLLLKIPWPKIMPRLPMIHLLKSTSDSATAILATAENAREFINTIFNADRYDISRVGRFRFNKRFGKSMDEKHLGRRTINLDDVTTIVSHVIELNNT